LRAHRAPSFLILPSAFLICTSSFNLFVASSFLILPSTFLSIPFLILHFLILNFARAPGANPASLSEKVSVTFAPMPSADFRQLANFIWSIAELLRHDYKQADYGKVILPFTVLRRLDCVLQTTKEKVLAKLKELQKKSKKPENLDPVLNVVAGQKFHNRSEFDFAKLAADDQHPAANLRAYINGFSANAREILEYFDFNTHIERLDRSKLLYQVIERFNERDLHPNAVDNETMGLVFEELIRKFAEISNETAGEHFTPREVIELMVNILFSEDSAVLRIVPNGCCFTTRRLCTWSQEKVGRSETSFCRKQSNRQSQAANCG
jgi:type I restriction-modification system DNA methylase subunit